MTRKNGSRYSMKNCPHSLGWWTRKMVLSVIDVVQALTDQPDFQRQGIIGKFLKTGF